MRNVAVAALAVGGAANAYAAVEAWGRCADLRALAALGPPFGGDVGWDVLRDASVGLPLHVAGLLLGAATFLPWFHRAVDNAKRSRHGRSIDGPAWAVAGFFVPVLNVFKPAQLMSELASVSRLMFADAAEHAGAAVPPPPTAGAVRRWWACYLVAAGLGVYGMFSAFARWIVWRIGAPDEAVVRDAAAAAALSVAHYVAAVLAAAALTPLVARITALHDGAAARVPPDAPARLG